MPSGHSMAAANIGNEEAIMIDSFILPIDGKSWRVLELGYTDCGKEILEDLQIGSVGTFNDGSVGCTVVALTGYGYLY